MAQIKALIDKYLTNASKGYLPYGFIADSINPVINVKEKSGLLAGYGSNHLRIVNTAYGGRGRAPRFESIVRSSDTYLVESHGLEGMVTPDDYRNVEDPYDAEKDETLGLVTVLKLSREKALADACGSTSILTQNETLATTAQFSDYQNSNPLGKFKTAQETVYDGCGAAPNIAFTAWKVANCLSYHPAILEALGFAMNRAGTLSEKEIASAMKVDRLLIGQPKYNSAALGQTASLSDVWGKNIVFAVAPSSAQKFQVAFGYQVRLIGEAPYATSKWEMNNPRGATGILVTDHYDDLLSNVLAAFLLKNAIA